MHLSITEEFFYLALYMAASLLLTCGGLLAIVASSIRVNETRLPRLLTKLRAYWAVPASGASVSSVYRWFYRLAGVGAVILTQGASLRLTTDAGSISLYGSAIFVWAALQWLLIVAWLAWLLWGFGHAASPGGTLPFATKPSDSSTLGPDKDSLWVDPQETGRGGGGNGDDQP